MRQIWITVLVLCCAAGAYRPAQADVEKGLRALNSKDYATAYREFLLSAREGEAEAQFQIGLLYFQGKGAPYDHEIAATYLRDASKQGHLKAQHQLAYTLSYSITAFGWMTEKTTEADLKKLAEAAHWYEELSKNGSNHAVSELLNILRWSKGKVGPKDQYIALLKRSAESGDKDNQYELANRMMKGDGLAKDPAGGARWAKTAAFNRHAVAAREVGLGFITGRIGERRPEDGIGLLFAASLLEDGHADFALAESFAGGFVLAKDLKLAHVYAARAKSRGFKGGARMRKLMRYIEDELRKARVSPKDLQLYPSRWRKADKKQRERMAGFYKAALQRFLSNSK